MGVKDNCGRYSAYCLVISDQELSNGKVDVCSIYTTDELYFNKFEVKAFARELASNYKDDDSHSVVHADELDDAVELYSIIFYDTEDEENRPDRILELKVFELHF